MSKKIKLLRMAVVGDDRLGGMSRTMHLTGDHLQEDGFEIRYVFHDKFRWKLHRGLARFTQPWEAGLRLMQAIHEWGGCDLAEVHEPLTLGCVLANQMFPRCRVIGFSYGIEERSRSAMLSYRDKHGIKTPIKGRTTSLVQGWQSTAGLRGCDHVVCSNYEDVKYLVGKGFKREQLTRHFSGVDESLLMRSAAGCNYSSSGMLYLGTWIERKGILEIAPAVAQVLRRHPEAFFTAAGCLVPEDVVRAAFPADVQPQLRVIRRVDSEQDLAGIYAEHSIFLLPSYYEGQPLVMMEAAAFGLAIVTTPICGMLDFIRPDESGLFTPVGEMEPLCGVLERLITDKQLTARIGMAARADVERHTWKESAHNLACAYRRVLDGNG